MNNQTHFRCTGHCCKNFALEYSYSQLQADYEAWKKDPATSKIPQIETIAVMVVPLKSNPKHGEHTYTCRNLDSHGNCTIYENRPQMCRDFPDSKGCQFWKCTSDQSIYQGLPLLKKLTTRWKWLRSL